MTSLAVCSPVPLSLMFLTGTIIDQNQGLPASVGLDLLA
jgi:hypothetical protein